MKFKIILIFSQFLIRFVDIFYFLELLRLSFKYGEKSFLGKYLPLPWNFRKTLGYNWLQSFENNVKGNLKIVDGMLKSQGFSLVHVILVLRRTRFLNEVT